MPLALDFGILQGNGPSPKLARTGDGAGEALGDVVRDGEGGAVELVAKTVAGAESGVFEQVLGQFLKPGSLLPDRGILEVFIGHGNLLGLGLLVWIGI